MSHEIVRIKSGVLAVRSVEVSEVMHPGIGPVDEARTLYVEQSALADRLKAAPLVTLFDVGLGAGSNALAAWQLAHSLAAGRLRLISYERDLGALELSLSQPSDFGFSPEACTAARALLKDGVSSTEHVEWSLRHGDLYEQLTNERECADLIFWDPFSPRVNPSLWSIAAFSAARRTANERALLITFSASTAPRVAMLAAGFHVGIGVSVGEKAATTIAACHLADLRQPLERPWLRRTTLKDAKLPLDAPADIVERLAALPQFR